MIKAGNKQIAEKAIYQERKTIGEESVTALRIELTEPLTSAQIDALTSHDWEIINADGETEGVQSGYNTLHELSAVFIKVSEKDEQIQALTEQVTEVSAQVHAVGTKLIDAVKDIPDKVIENNEFVKELTPGQYAVGDVRKLNGQIKRCTIAHDSTVNVNWTFDEGTIWYPYHGSTPETALPWLAPTGGHDVYKVGEYMIFTDGKTYRCKSNTNYSPIEYAQAWELSL